jgi:hypothetical protein
MSSFKYDRLSRLVPALHWCASHVYESGTTTAQGSQLTTQPQLTSAGNAQISRCLHALYNHVPQSMERQLCLASFPRTLACFHWGRCNADLVREKLHRDGCLYSAFAVHDCLHHLKPALHAGGPERHFEEGQSPGENKIRNYLTKLSLLVLKDGVTKT